MNKGIILILATAIISGVSIWLNKFSVSVFNPYIFTGLKNIAVAVLACSWLIMLKDWQLLGRLNKKQWLILLGIGLIGGSVPFLLFFKGLSLTSASQASFIHKTMFVYIGILAFIFLKEKLSRGFILAGLIILLGNILMLKTMPRSFGWGDAMIFLAVLLWAIENILSKYLIKDLPSRIIIWARMFFGSVFIIIFWLITNQPLSVFSLDARQIGWLLITSVLLFGYVATWYSGLKYIEVSKAAIILSLGGPITSLLALLDGKTLASNEMWAGGLIVVAVAMAIAGYINRKSILSRNA